MPEISPRLSPASLVPMAHVADVRRSIAFYARLGFEVLNTFTPHGASEPTWAFLEAREARLMVNLASGPVVPDQQAVLFYLYFDEIRSAHKALASMGLDVGPLTFPSYRLGGEFRLMDPDGYCLMLTHT